jgi:predicted nucleic acid-binding protein
VILVDTSVLLGFLRQEENAAVEKFEEVLSKNRPFGISHLIYQEVLQGASSEKDFSALKKYLDTQKFYAVKSGLESHASAAAIYIRCREKGITIRSTIDCLIGQMAIENNLWLLHHDMDFTRMAKVIKELQIY